VSLRVIGAGPPRTGTASLKSALGRLLGEPCYHMQESADATILTVVRDPRAWGAGSRNDLVELLQRFTGSDDWDDRDLLMRSYDAHLAAVRAEVPPDRLVEWRPGDGWEPLCRALDVPVPAAPFPHDNKRSARPVRRADTRQRAGTASR
jgi:hypothetical protein